MRLIPLSAGFLFATLTFGQTQPNAVRVTKYIIGVADLDRTYAFYHALGLDLEKPGPLAKPNVLPEMLLKLVDVPAGTKFRNMMLKIPNATFPLEVTEFSGTEIHAVKPRLQDPGAAILKFTVGDLEAALAAAKRAGGVVSQVTIGKMLLKDPDGYYLELTQAGTNPTGDPKVTGASFGSMVVPDASKAGSFYKSQFGFAVKNLDPKGSSVEVSIPGNDLTWGLVDYKSMDRKPYTPRIPDPGAAAIGLQVRDIDAAIAAVKAAGGTSVTQGGSVKLGSGRVGFVRDPNGILVELAQP